MPLNLGRMLTIGSLTQISELLRDIGAGDLCLVDVDDTLITPCSVLCRGNQNFIHELKQRRDEIPAFETLLGNWRLQRKTQLVEASWPAHLQNLLDKHVTVVALTKIETDAFGPIKSMEDWRVSELLSLGLTFTSPIDGKDSFKLLESDQGYSCFKRGVLCTGPFIKSDVLKAFLPYLHKKPKRIIAIDDRQDQLDELGAFAETRSLPFTGIFYRAAEFIKGIPDPAIAHLQKTHLLRTHQWLEEHEAKRLLESS